MKRIIKIQTQDGMIHNSVREAKNHADKLYGNKLCNLAHNALKQLKYKDMTEFIHNNLHEFVELQRLAQDLKMEDNQEELDY